MRGLIVVYSRTGITKKLAEAINQSTGWEIAEIFDTTDRSGALGYLKSGRDAMAKKPAKIKPLNQNLAEYDLVIVGTPIWAWTVSTPVRTFLEQYRQDCRRLAFFCTMGGSGDQGAFTEMAAVSQILPEATLALTTKQVVNQDFSGPLKEFLTRLGIA